MGHTSFVLLRQFHLKDGQRIQLAVTTFRDKDRAVNAAEAASREMQLGNALQHVLRSLGIMQIGHAVMELPFVDGSGLVIAGADTQLPPPPGP